MKKWVKRGFFGLMIILAMIGLGLSFWYHSVKTQWKEIWTEDEIKAKVEMIEKSPPPPQLLYHLYDSMYPGLRSSTMFDMLWDRSRPIFNNDSGMTGEIRYRNCSCAKLYALQGLIRDGGSPTSYGFALTEYTTPEKCFNYIIYHSPVWLQGQKFDGLDDLSLHLFNKEIELLDRRECLQLIDALMKRGQNPLEKDQVFN